jgi:hypothetical protein
MTDVVETQESRYHPTALLAARYYNNVEKKRGVYLAPYKSNVCPFHVVTCTNRRSPLAPSTSAAS